MPEIAPLTEGGAVPAHRPAVAAVAVAGDHRRLPGGHGDAAAHVLAVREEHVALAHIDAEGADLRAAAPQTKVPTICIVGDQDGSTPPSLVLELAKSIPEARYEVIKGAGHIPCVEQPEILVEIFRAFFKDAGIT